MANKKIRQEINILNREITATTGDLGEIINFIGSDYNGESVYLEVVAKNANASNQNVILHDSGDTAKSTLAITASTSSYTRFRSSSFTPSDDEHHINIGSTDISLKSAKVIILQDATDITDTQTQIEIGSYEINTSAGATGTWYPLDNPKVWKYEASKWEDVIWFGFGFTGRCEDDMDTISVRIQESADAAFTSPTNLTTTNINITSETVAYYDLGDNFWEPNDGYYYRLVWSTNDTKTGFDCYNAKIIVYSVSNMSKHLWRYNEHSCYSGSGEGVGQSFEGDGTDVTGVRLHIRKYGSPTGNAYVRLYAHSGTYGSSSIPTGSSLADSAAIDVSALSTTASWQEYSFTSAYTTTDGTKYVVAFEFSGGSLNNSVRIAYDSVYVDHPGNYCSSDDLSTWSANSGRDMVQIVLSDGSVGKLQNEYLLINEAQTDTGLQEYQTYYDLAEWDDGAGGLPTFHHEHSANSASSNTKLVAVDANLEDSDNQSIGGQRTYDAVAQSFTGAGFDLISCKFVLSKLGTPTGNCYAKLYAHSGTYGTSSVPTGSALATSDAFDVSTLSSTPTWHELSFSTPYTLVDGTKYCIVAEFTGGNNINYIYVRYKNSDVHEGNFSRRATSGGSWSSQSSWDVSFMAFAEITNSDITGDDLTRGSSALTMPTSAKEIDAYIVTA